MIQPQTDPVDVSFSLRDLEEVRSAMESFFLLNYTMDITDKLRAIPH